jgi:hypothetical protein
VYGRTIVKRKEYKMYSLTISELLIDSRYRSGSRNFEGVIVEAEKVDYSDNYIIRVREDGFPRYHYATIEVTA